MQKYVLTERFVCLFAGFLSFVFSAGGGTYVWKGPDTGGTWANSANWEPSGVPDCGDIAYFTRDVTIASDFTVTAGAASQLILSNETGTALTLDCSVGGTGGLHKAGDGNLHLKKANPFSGDFTTLGVSNCAWQVGKKGFSCQVFIYDGGALGTKKAHFDLDNGSHGSRLNVMEPMEVTTEIRLSGDGISQGNLNFANTAGQTVTFKQPLTSPLRYLATGPATTKVVFDAAIDFSRAYSHWGSAFDYVIKAPSRLSTFYFDTNAKKVRLDASGNDISSSITFNSGAQLTLGADNAIIRTGTNKGTVSFANNSWIDLNGHDQTFALADLKQPSTVSQTNYGFTSPEACPAMVRITKPANAQTAFRGQFAGAAGLEWGPSDETPAEFTFVKTVQPTKGTLRVSRGTVRVADGAGFSQLSRLELAGTGRLAVDADAGAVVAEEVTVAESGALACADGKKVNAARVSAQSPTSGLLDLTGVEPKSSGTMTVALAGNESTEATLMNVSHGEGTVSLEKSGAGTWILQGTNDLNGALAVRSGTLVVKDRTSVPHYTWYRLAIKDRFNTSRSSVFTSKFALYDAAGSNRVAGLKYRVPPTWSSTATAGGWYVPAAVADLWPGEALFCRGSATGKIYKYEAGHGNELPRLFDGSASGANWRFETDTLEYGKPDTYHYVVMRLPEGSPAVTHYDLSLSAVPNNQAIRIFAVEGSFDGVSWTALTDDITNSVDQVTKNWLNGDPVEAGQPLRPGCGYPIDTGVDPSVSSGDLYRWYRLVFKGRFNEGQSVEYMSKFALYDAAGSNRVADLAYCLPPEFTGASGTFVPAPVASMKAGETLMRYEDATKKITKQAADYANEYTRMFDSSTSGARARFTSSPLPDDPTSWLYVVMRVAEDTPAITHYDMSLSAVPNNQTFRIFALEASTDGVHWEKLTDDVTNTVDQITDNWLNGDPVASGQPLRPGCGYPIRATARADLNAGGERTLDAVTSVQVDAGAELKTTGDRKTLRALTVDATVGAGTLRGFDYASSGTLNLINVTDPRGDISVSLDLQDVTPWGLSNLSGWTLLVNGEESDRPRDWKIENGRIIVASSRLGTILLIGSAIVDPSTVTRTVEIEYASAAAAEQAIVTTCELPAGKNLAFSTRWDDTNEKHKLTTAALEEVGFRATCYLNGTSASWLPAFATELYGRGGSFGAHTVSHPYLYNLDAVGIFREVMVNRIDIESVVQSAVNAFVLPYGSAGNAAQAALIGESLSRAGLMGGAELNACATAYALPANRWTGSITFDINDSAPDAELFASRYAAATNKIFSGEATWGPHLTLGIHSRQDDAGRETLKSILSPVANLPTTWYCNENEYVAFRMQALNAQIVRTVLAGNRATYAVTVPAPYRLGASVPLTLHASEAPVGRAQTFDLPALENAMPVQFAKVDGLTCNAARTRFYSTFVNPESEQLSSVELTLRLPVSYAVGTARKLLQAVGPGATLSSGWRVTPPDGTAKNAPVVAAVQIDAVKPDGTRVRYYQTLDVP